MTAVIDTKTGYRVFCEVVAQRGPRLSDLARTCGLPRSRTKEILNELIESGDVHVVDNRYYVRNNGITRIAHHNMNYYQTVSSVVTHAPSTAVRNSPIVEKRYNAVNRVYARFKADRYGVFNGRRMAVGGTNCPEPWFPDLWIVVPGIRNLPVISPVMVDPSTQCGNVIKEILRGYRRAKSGDPHDWTLFVVAKNQKVVESFLFIGDDLNIKATTLRDCLTGDLDGPDSVWLTLGWMDDPGMASQ